MAGTGTPILEAERLAAVLGDAIDAGESLQAPHPNETLENILHSIRFVRRRLIELIPPEVAHGQEVGK